MSEAQAIIVIVDEFGGVPESEVANFVAMIQAMRADHTDGDPYKHLVFADSQPVVW